eukprot:CCRYP_009621-RB/>CCRYP_009621-RB protein AED:0.07 eAED:0.07 QI:21/1/1/1/1/1/4/889/522
MSEESFLSSSILVFLSSFTALLLTILTVSIQLCRRHFAQLRNSIRICTDDTNSRNEQPLLVAFFHPNCSAGGGGERVLWKAIGALGEMKEEGEKKMNLGERRDTCCRLSVVVYTTDEERENYKVDLVNHIRDRFSISISSSLDVSFVHLNQYSYLLEKSKRWTMIAESWGTIQLAWYALQKRTPHVFFDTTGCAFTFLVAKVLAGCKVGAYVHYPTISTDMLSLVWERRPSYNNNTSISTNPIITYAKLLYYTFFAIAYGLTGSLADLIIVNSSWTKGHIQYLWRLAGDIHVVFPPVDTKSLEQLSLTHPPRDNLILSIGQFRPEKDHTLQLKAFALLLEMHNGEMRTRGDVKLLLIGSCRDDDDRERVDRLQALAREWNISDSVKFVLNQPHSVLREYLSRASVGIHTMWNEHFGIGLVEMMAAGLVTVAHDSGGPKADIIQSPWNVPRGGDGVSGDQSTGCLATTAEEYANAIYEIIKRGSSSREILKMRENGRKSAERFSDEVFVKSLKEILLASSLLT